MCQVPDACCSAASQMKANAKAQTLVVRHGAWQCVWLCRHLELALYFEPSVHPLQCNVCRQTFLCTSNRAKLQEHIDGKHSGKNAHTFEVRACALLPFCMVDMPAWYALSA